MNIRRLIFSFCVLITSGFNAQIFETSQDDRFIDMIKLNDGSFISAGHSNSFGAGGSDFTLIKFDVNQNILWYKAYGTTADEGGFSLAVSEDLEGNLILVGFSKYQSSNGNGIVMKLTAEGDVIWSKVTEQNDTHYRDCAVDAENNILVCGLSEIVTHGGSDAALGKLDPDGNVLWSKVVGSSNDDHFTDVNISGDCIRFSGQSKEFGGGGRNTFDIKVNGDGDWLDSDSYSTGEDDNFNHSIFSSDGGFVNVGYVEIGNLHRTLIAKRNSSDELVFMKSIYLPGQEWRGGSIIEVNGHYYISSRVIDGAENYIVLSKISSSGNVEWSKKSNAIGNHLFEYWAGNIIFNAEQQVFCIPGYVQDDNSENSIIISYSMDSQETDCHESITVFSEDIEMEHDEEYSTELELTFENISFSQTDIPFEDEIQITPICETEFACDLSVDISMEVPCFSDVLMALPETANGSDDMSFTWRLNQEVIGTIEELEYEMNSSGSFELSLTVTDNLNNCTAESSIGFNVSPDILVEPLNDISVCQEAAATINPIAFGYDSFQWSDGETSLNRTLSTAGVYSITFTNNCEAVTETFTVEFLENPFLALESNYILCENESIELQISSELDIFLNGELVSSSLEMAEAGEFLLTAAGSCNFSHEFTVEIAEQMSLELPTLLSICEGEAVSITPVAENYEGFQWSDGYPELNRIINLAGNYSLTLQTSCESLSEAVSVELLENPLVGIESNYLLCEGELLEMNINTAAEVFLNGQMVGLPLSMEEPGDYELVTTIDQCNFSAQFSIEEVGIPVLVLPELSPLNYCQILNSEPWPWASNYSSYSYNHTTDLLELELSNECFAVSDVILIPEELCVECNPVMFIPTAFTPNQDNLNEVFKPMFECEQSLKSYKLQIFNRWGEKLFETTHFSEGWKGDINNGDHYAQNGVYVWQLSYSFTNLNIETQTIEKRGTVTIVR